MRSLRTFLEDLGVVPPPGSALITALAISADGSTVVGQAIDPNLPAGASTFCVATIPTQGLFTDGFETGDVSGWTSAD